VAPVPNQRNGKRADDKNQGDGEEFGVELIVVDKKFDSFDEDKTRRGIGDSSAPDIPFPELLGETAGA